MSPFDVDRAVDRRRLKRGITVWRIAAILLAAVLGAVLFDGGAIDRATGPFRGDRFAELEISGFIAPDDDLYERLDKVAEDDGIKALIVRIDSGGGSTVGGELNFEALRRVAEEKPVVAVMESIAASAAYMTALGADRIFAHGETLTGSVGVYLQAVEGTELMRKLGIEAELIKSAPLKAQPNPMEELTDEGRAALQEVVADSYQYFRGLVATRRALEGEALDLAASGRIFTGRQALAAGLVDALGGRDAALDWLDAEKGLDAALPIEDITPRPDDDRGLFARASDAIVHSLLKNTELAERLSVDGLVSVWHPRP
ncbi:Clp protease [Tistrella bauzanensis]|uniref:Clp protease n=1 Tax=Tistrella bauzanensis TaxID=657419 RepID=A0ABQ1ICA5_9PROT|nr:signal peptide peptidase SppA [Tistrella bauzanensis]GGB34330.1 Clp protease [Tistrella bauzanensis]